MATLFFGYVDWTVEGEPFYVGIGTEFRSKGLVSNGKHSNVARKHGQVRTIEFETADRAEAVAWEIATIHRLQTFHRESDTGLGCNFTFGGEGTLGRGHSKEVRQRIAQKLKGRKLPAEVVAKVLETKRRNPFRFTAEQRAKISASKKGKARPDLSERNRSGEWVPSATWRAKCSERMKRTWAERRAQKEMA